MIYLHHKWFEIGGKADIFFDKYIIPGGRIIHKDMGNGAHQFAVLNNRWTVAHRFLPCRDALHDG